MTAFNKMARNAQEIIDEVISRLTPQQKAFLDDCRGYSLQFAHHHWPDPIMGREWTEAMSEYRHILEVQRGHHDRDPYGPRHGTVKERLGLWPNDYCRPQCDGH